GDFSTVELPPIEREDAVEIIERICTHYHRVLEPEVVDALLAKTNETGFAWGNPLWLILATEEINLIDADDFESARGLKGTPVEELRELMCRKVGEMPGAIIPLYGRTFDRGEALFGQSWTRTFLGLIAVSRGGWRESDFRSLVPRVTSEPWDALRFAALRR